VPGCYFRTRGRRHEDEPIDRACLHRARDVAAGSRPSSPGVARALGASSAAGALAKVGEHRAMRQYHRLDELDHPVLGAAAGLANDCRIYGLAVRGERAGRPARPSCDEAVALGRTETRCRNATARHAGEAAQKSSRACTSGRNQRSCEPLVADRRALSRCTCLEARRRSLHASLLRMWRAEVGLHADDNRPRSWRCSLPFRPKPRAQQGRRHGEAQAEQCDIMGHAGSLH